MGVRFTRRNQFSAVVEESPGNHGGGGGASIVGRDQPGHATQKLEGPLETDLTGNESSKELLKSVREIVDSEIE